MRRIADDAMRKLVCEMSQQHGHFIVFDLHFYNHRRQGLGGPAADPEGNPQVKIMKATSEPVDVPNSGRAQRLCIAAGSCSIQGARRDTNENNRYVSLDMRLFIVADGMGDHAAGEVASKFAVDVLSNELAPIAVDAHEKEVEYRVHVSLDRAHCLILDSAANDPKCAGAEITVVLALLLNHRLYVTGVGAAVLTSCVAAG